MNKNDYDLVAYFYVFIRNIVFGNRIDRAQSYFLYRVKPGDRILIAGGGAGKILLNPDLSNKELEIDFVDSSNKMLGLARRRKSLSKINFVCADILVYKPDLEYDVIIFPFILDVFNPANLRNIVNLTKKWLKMGGIVIINDFAPPAKFSQKVLLWFMFIFFKIVTRIESDRLLNIEQCFNDNGFKKMARIEFSDGFIFSAIYMQPS